MLQVHESKVIGCAWVFATCLAASAWAGAGAADLPTMIPCEELLTVSDFASCGAAVVEQPDRLVGRTCMPRYRVDDQPFTLLVQLDQGAAEQGPELQELADVQARLAGGSGPRAAAQSTLGRATITLSTLGSRSPCSAQAELERLLRAAVARFPAVDQQAKLGEAPTMQSLDVASSGAEPTHAAPVPPCGTWLSGEDVDAACRVQGVFLYEPPVDLGPAVGSHCAFALGNQIYLSVNVGEAERSVQAAKARFASPFRSPYALGGVQVLQGLGNQAVLGTVVAPDADLGGERYLQVRTGNVVFSVEGGRGQTPSCGDEGMRRLAATAVSRMP